MREDFHGHHDQAMRDIIDVGKQPLHQLHFRNQSLLWFRHPCGEVGLLFDAVHDEGNFLSRLNHHNIPLFFLSVSIPRTTLSELLIAFTALQVGSGPEGEAGN